MYPSSATYSSTLTERWKPSKPDNYYQSQWSRACSLTEQSFPKESAQKIYRGATQVPLAADRDQHNVRYKDQNSNSGHDVLYYRPTYGARKGHNCKLISTWSDEF